MREPCDSKPDKDESFSARGLNSLRMAQSGVDTQTLAQAVPGRPA